MLKALLLDLDETLCDTQNANEQAKLLMGNALEARYGAGFDGRGVARFRSAGRDEDCRLQTGWAARPAARTGFLVGVPHAAHPKGLRGPGHSIRFGHRHTD